MDPFTLFYSVFARNHLGREVQDRRRGPPGEATGEGEGRWEAIGKVCGRTEEEGGRIRLAERGGRPPEGQKSARRDQGGQEVVGEGLCHPVLLRHVLPCSCNHKGYFV
ncbi:hypothetical protein F2P56_004012 [Juglans regia]|uniref:Uncharacterized protein n=1 Tax=Juglans regia TaxID=51240 RepID=A0A834D5Q2_JUGRE|nr:hypothetical protein F2P56_004012 [Juglans regia]